MRRRLIETQQRVSKKFFDSIANDLEGLSFELAISPNFLTATPTEERRRVGFSLIVPDNEVAAGTLRIDGDCRHTFCPGLFGDA